MEIMRIIQCLDIYREKNHLTPKMVGYEKRQTEDDANVEVSHTTYSIKNDGENVFVWLGERGTNIMKS